MKRTQLTSLLFLFLFLFGCSATPMIVQNAEVKAVREIPKGAEARPIQFTKNIVKIQRGDTTGHLYYTSMCQKYSDLKWEGGKLSSTDAELAQAFREELLKYNYPVVGDPNAIFEDASTWKAELLVAAIIDKLEANACFPNVPYSWDNGKGGAFIQVHWQVYGQLERKVIYEITTQGSYLTNEPSSNGIPQFITNAFAIAAHNLLADEGFHNLVLPPKSQSARILPEPAYAAISIDKNIKPIKGISDARAGAVTIFAGVGHGSGFIISPSGYVITNEHVVREARFVKVRLANGREILGDVVRTDPPRDVALIKVAESNLPCLSLRLTTSPDIGDEVYALGTPLSQKLDISVTKGIVSAYRDEGNLKYIQSDVQIHPGSSGGPLVDKNGNVVGISVMGLGINGASQNLNFFVPITDAVSRLKIEFK